MDQEPQHAKQFRDEELALIRHAKFGEPPARMAPDNLIETREADPPHEEPQEPLFRREWALGSAAPIAVGQGKVGARAPIAQLHPSRKSRRQWFRAVVSYGHTGRPHSGPTTHAASAATPLRSKRPDKSITRH